MVHNSGLVNVILPVKDQYVIVIFKWYFLFSSLWIFRRVSLVEQELLTFRRTWVHPWFLVARSLVFYVVFCRSLFIFWFVFFWRLCCLSYNIQITNCRIKICNKRRINGVHLTFSLCILSAKIVRAKGILYYSLC